MIDHHVSTCAMHLPSAGVIDHFQYINSFKTVTCQMSKADNQDCQNTMNIKHTFKSTGLAVLHYIVACAYQVQIEKLI